MLDFDGTITEDDLLDRIAREFGDPAVYQQVEDGLHAGTVTLQECITREYEPVTMPIEDAVAWVLEQVRVRPGLPELVALARGRGWRVTVLSSGFEELIRPVLAAGVVGVDVVANTVDAVPTAGASNGTSRRSAPPVARPASAAGCLPTVRSSTSATASRIAVLRRPRIGSSPRAASPATSTSATCPTSPSRTSTMSPGTQRLG